MGHLALPRWAANNQKPRSWRYIAIAAGAALLLILLISRHSIPGSSHRHIAALETGEGGKCLRTMLYRFDDRRGFGSEITMFARAALFAGSRGYALLIDDSHWNYGRLDDYFVPAQPACLLPVDAHTRDRIDVGEEGWLEADHILSSRYTSQVIDRWVADNYIDIDGWFSLESLFNPLRPLDHDMIVPPPFQRAYNALYAVHQELFRPQRSIIEAVEQLELDFKVHTADRAPLIGLHFRGGDKLTEECTDSSCANTTVYAMAALEALNALPSPACKDCKAILAIMTVEPHVIDHLQAEPLIANRFYMQRLPPSAAAGAGHDESRFLDLDIAMRIEDTKILIRDALFLVSRADAVVASMRSNIGLVMAQWTPRGHIMPFSIDTTYYPLSWGWRELGITPPPSVG